MEKVRKKIGLGSISLLLCVLGIIFAFSFGDKGCFGDALLNSIGLEPWSNDSSGIHYTIFYTPIFLIPSFIIGYKFKNSFGAKLGKIISLILLILIIIEIPLLIA